MVTADPDLNPEQAPVSPEVLSPPSSPEKAPLPENTKELEDYGNKIKEDAGVAFTVVTNTGENFLNNEIINAGGTATDVEAGKEVIAPIQEGARDALNDLNEKVQGEIGGGPNQGALEDVISEESTETGVMPPAPASEAQSFTEETVSAAPPETPEPSGAKPETGGAESSRDELELKNKLAARYSFNVEKVKITTIANKIETDLENGELSPEEAKLVFKLIEERQRDTETPRPGTRKKGYGRWKSSVRSRLVPLMIRLRKRYQEGLVGGNKPEPVVPSGEVGPVEPDGTGVEAPPSPPGGENEPDQGEPQPFLPSLDSEVVGGEESSETPISEPGPVSGEAVPPAEVSGGGEKLPVPERGEDDEIIEMPRETNLAEVSDKKELKIILEKFIQGKKIWSGNGEDFKYFKLVGIAGKEAAGFKGKISDKSLLKFKIYNKGGKELGEKEVTLKQVNFREWKKANKPPQVDNGYKKKDGTIVRLKAENISEDGGIDIDGEQSGPNELYASGSAYKRGVKPRPEATADSGAEEGAEPAAEETPEKTQEEVQEEIRAEISAIDSNDPRALENLKTKLQEFANKGYEIERPDLNTDGTKAFAKPAEQIKAIDKVETFVESFEDKNNLNWGGIANNCGVTRGGGLRRKVVEILEKKYNSSTEAGGAPESVEDTPAEAPAEEPSEAPADGGAAEASAPAPEGAPTPKREQFEPPDLSDIIEKDGGSGEERSEEGEPESPSEEEVEEEPQEEPYKEPGGASGEEVGRVEQDDDTDEEYEQGRGVFGRVWDEAKQTFKDVAEIRKRSFWRGFWREVKTREFWLGPKFPKNKN